VSVFVVDASVVIKWFVPEIHGDAARRLLEHDDHQYFAPDLVFPETSNALWKKVRRGELTSAQGQHLVRDLGSIAVETIPARALANDAYSLAISTGCSVYDAMYLALAVRLDARMLTTDERLARTLSVMPLAASHILTIQDFH
jgi:predicted nucleic acid-binding protein